MADVYDDDDFDDDDRLAFAIQESLITYGHDTQIREDEKCAQALHDSLNAIGRFSFGYLQKSLSLYMIC